MSLGASTWESVTGALQLPAVTSTTYWDDTQWTIFWSLLDAVLPSIRDESTSSSDGTHQLKVPNQQLSELYQAFRTTVANPPSEEQFMSFLDYNPVQDAAFRDNVKRTLSVFHDSAQKQLGGSLASLGSTRAGSLLLTGYWDPPHMQPLHVRHTILKSWQKSRIKALRVLSKAITALALKGMYQSSSLFLQLSGWTDVPENHEPADGYDFKFKQFDAGPHPEVVETDVVIVGSGCGGAVCAKVLAEAGHRVVVVEKSYYFPPSQLPMPQEAACQYLFENGGLFSSDDASVNVVTGSCWGGGGTINWSVSLQTQGYVRKEWAEEKGLLFFTSARFQDALDRVCDFMGVGTEHNVDNKRARFLMDGSRKLGWHASPAPQNTGREEHDCGRCHLGCATMGKKGPVASWLPAAAEAGVEFIEGLNVDKVLFDETGGSKSAIGISGKWISRDADGGVSGPKDKRVTRDIIVRAKKVIVSAGTLISPLILMRSGLKNRHIGKHLKLHPTNMVIGIWKEDMNPWEAKLLTIQHLGGIITALNHSFEDLDGHGHGVKLEPTCMVPYAILSNIPWRGGLESKLDALKYRNACGYISLTRDRDSGSVYPDPITGLPHIAYTASDFDRAHTLEGIIALAKICYVEGAVEIYATLPGVEPFVRGRDTTRQNKAPVAAGQGDVGDSDVDGDISDMDGGINDPEFAAWLGRLREVGNRDATFASAHQMGTCRMAINEYEGVVDPKGRLFEAEGLYVADASVFPSASGVNPMVTNMAIADWIAQGVSNDLKLSNDLKVAGC
ncbi:long chain fatty alcohol oxidase [Ilyonectria destructans]|nr:long chain fatty alcohol oxidase [Ilyonectria destructans]